MFEIELTADAKHQLEAMTDWLLEHGDPERLETELARATRALAQAPWLGPPVARRPDLRRLLLRRSRVHVYYSVDQTNQVVLVRAFWHTARGEAPPL
jgi:plasmid stabilization system protein ParE